MNGVPEAKPAFLLRWLRIPPAPEPPAGGPGSVRTFRAGRNDYYMKVAVWAVRQVAVVVGFVFGFLFLHFWVSKAEPIPDLPVRIPGWVRNWHGILLLLEIAAVPVALVQAVLSFLLVRLDFALHWYMVTDRSLRIRDGILQIRELTLSFANIQQVRVEQGPVQRLLGIADVVVTTAGGGGHAAAAPNGAGSAPTHVGHFRGVDNAAEIRDLMIERLRLFRDSGLGDPGEPVEPVKSGTPAGEAERAAPTEAAALDAARDVLAEVRKLREACGNVGRAGLVAVHPAVVGGVSSKGGERPCF